MSDASLKQAARDQGLAVLESLKPRNDVETRLGQEAKSLGAALADAEEACAWLSTIYALRAVTRGNFGIGSVLVDAEDRVVAAGHNEVFHPRFRSDAHAEMVVMNQFEERVQGAGGMGRYRLLSSLESCPMCLSRLIAAGVGTVLHISDDESGGMVHKFADLPQTWRRLAEGRVYRRARCARAIVEVSDRIFRSNVDELNNALLVRSASE